MILAIPLLLIFTTALVFRYASTAFGKEKGYLVGFGFYWLFWCVLIPCLLVGKLDLTGLLTDRLSLFNLQNWPAALLWILITAVTLFMYGKSFVKASLTLFLLAIPLAVVNGFCEEMLWRGVYVQTFTNNFWLGVLYPAVGFALWHLVPQSVFPAENKLAFIISTLFLGVAYGFIAYRTGSALWTAISHSVNGILATSGMVAPSILKLMRRRPE